jgi:hypothetical protein
MWYKFAIDYRVGHEAPDKTSGVPIHDMSDFYPEDFYNWDGYKRYPAGFDYDQKSHMILRNLRNKPHSKVKIYRSIPRIEIPDPKDMYAYLMKKGDRAFEKKYGISDEEFRAKYPESPELKWEKGVGVYWVFPESFNVEKPVYTINPGDWVTLAREYAKQHGESNLNNNYKILSKIVPAKHVYTTADSLHEFGYDPS